MNCDSSRPRAMQLNSFIVTKLTANIGDLFNRSEIVHSLILTADFMIMTNVDEPEEVVPGGQQRPASSESCMQLQTLASTTATLEENEELRNSGGQASDDEDHDSDLSDSQILEMLSTLPYHVFVLSSYGKPIFASTGHEDRMCPLFALIQAFVYKVESRKDNLCCIDAPNLHVRFSHRHPLILCIVSRTPFQLSDQLDVVYHQILSIISTTQLKKAYELMGENYDIRRLMRGSSDRSLYGCLRSWRADPAVSMSGVRILPMAHFDREFLASTIASTVNAANLTGSVIFSVILVRRQLVAYVRMKGYLLAPCDLHTLLNTVYANVSDRSEKMLAICLPRFNSQGFLHVHMSYLWDDSEAVLLFITTAKNQFSALSTIKQEIVRKLNSSRYYPSVRQAIQRPISFDLKQIDCPELWHFIYNNTASAQMCSSAFGKPFISETERAYLVKQYNGLHSYVKSSELHNHPVKTLFISKSNCVVYVVVSTE
ncbi:hypothetical protein QR680_002981 [Steinernema hermaphroditum]|uniref:Vacuolar fusion protein MON1 homolog n=1 Tax=Steinernema hermaphroditum TaxID=289476 RepID=A0AA39H516_9BILA|nr:hypothetical protein QR680_002981 [Steinernema hermaphroditum]